MDRHGSITPPPESIQNNNESISGDLSRDANYPPRQTMIGTNHTRDASISSIKSTGSESRAVPRIFGLSLKYVSLVTLALQNASLAIIMHYSRVSVAPDKVYSAASAVLLNEILKGGISFAIAYTRTKATPDSSRIYEHSATPASPIAFMRPALPCPTPSSSARLRTLLSQIASQDSWKLSIPALLYVLQNNLQYIAVSNLDVPTFQVTNQLKILTTAACSVVLLRKRLNSWKWISLVLLAIGVGIVQIQASRNSSTPAPIELPEEDVVSRELTMDPAATMNPAKGFLAVSAACFTSGLAGVYFEMVLKGSKTDLWVRNVQLSLWSLIPALLPVLISLMRDGMRITDMFINFGGWAWATVLTQVAGGLITALVIKYSDNILKGFATSLSILLSSIASVALFNLQITPSFVGGSAVVLGATWMYNSPETPLSSAEKFGHGVRQSRENVPLLDRSSMEVRKSTEGEFIFDAGEDEEMHPCNAPIDSHEPLLGYPSGVGSSSRLGHSKKPSMSGRILEKVSNIVGSSNGHPSQGRDPSFGDEKAG